MASLTPWSDAPAIGTRWADQPLQRPRELPPIGIEDGDMVQPGVARRRRRAAAALPGVQADVMVVARRPRGTPLAFRSAGQRKPEHVTVERNGALEIRDLQMDVADADVWVDRFGGRHAGPSGSRFLRLSRQTECTQQSHSRLGAASLPGTVGIRAGSGESMHLVRTTALLALSSLAVASAVAMQRSPARRP